MKNKKKVIALGGAILAIAATIGIGTWIGSSKNENNTVVSDEEQVESSSAEELPLVSEDGVNLTMTEENFDEIKVNMSIFGDAVIVKELSDITFDEEGNWKSNELIENVEYHMINSTNEYYTLNTSAIHSDPELKEDYSNISEICDKHIIDTEQYFGKNVANCKNVFDLSLAVADTYDIDTSSFINSRLDKEIYDAIYADYKQKIYYINVKENFNYSSIGLNEDDYDKIISNKITLTTDIDENVGEYISFISMMVNYKKDNEEHQRILTFIVRIPDIQEQLNTTK